MAYKISESECVACGTCISECPAGAIVEGDVYHIDPNLCLDCGTCAGVCPMGADSSGRRVVRVWNPTRERPAAMMLSASLFFCALKCIEFRKIFIY